MATIPILGELYRNTEVFAKWGASVTQVEKTFAVLLIMGAMERIPSATQKAYFASQNRRGGVWLSERQPDRGAAIGGSEQQLHGGDRGGDSGLLSADHSLSLSAFLEPIKTVVKVYFGEAQWVRAEIAGIKSSSRGHFYLNLVEYRQSASPLARVSANLWADKARILMPIFRRRTGFELAADQKVLLKLRLTMHTSYGLSATVEDIDPSYTIGVMADLLSKLREKLKSQGLYGLQESLPVKGDFFRVAVISPWDASALSDFRRISDKLEPVCSFEYFGAAFQGEACVSTIIAALAQIHVRHYSSPFDAIVIIRGGGSKSDLHYLNDYRLARAVCRSPIPIFSGIGHEADTTIIDEVCSRRFSTPTRAAIYIRDQIAASAGKSLQNFASIRNAAMSTIVARRTSNDAAIRVLGRCAKYQIGLQYHKVLSQRYVSGRAVVALQRQAGMRCDQHLRQLQQGAKHLFNVAQNQLAAESRQMKNSGRAVLSVSRVRIQRQAERLATSRQLVFFAHQHLDVKRESVQMACKKQYQQTAAQLASRKIEAPAFAVERRRSDLDDQYRGILDTLRNIARSRSKALAQHYWTICQNHPQRILKLGFGIIRQNGRVVTRAYQADVSQAVEIQFFDRTTTKH